MQKHLISNSYGKIVLEYDHIDESANPCYDNQICKRGIKCHIKICSVIIIRIGSCYTCGPD